MAVAWQGLPCYTAVARLGFKRRATAVLKWNLIRSIEFGTAVARRLKRALDLVSGQLTSSCYLYSPPQYSELDSLSTIKHSNFQIVLAHHELFVPHCVRKGSLYERSDRLLKADGSTNIHNNP